MLNKYNATFLKFIKYSSSFKRTVATARKIVNLF